MQIFNYPGNKLKYVDQINGLVAMSNARTYIEPFCGTASVFLNLPRKFDEYVLNDWSSEVMRILKSFRDGSYDQLVQAYADVATNFGDIQRDKEAYYSFRNHGNVMHFKTDTIEEGFFLYMASRAAINSLFRIGPTGFNQSFGNRGGTLKLKEGEFDYMKDRLQNAELLCEDYLYVMVDYQADNTLFFLDPPYVRRKVQGSYKDEKDFSQNFFLSNVKQAAGDIIYTDVFDQDILDTLGPKWKFVPLADKKNISPGNNRTPTIDYTEVAYYNF